VRVSYNGSTRAFQARYRGSNPLTRSKNPLVILKVAKKVAAAIRKSKYKSEGINLFLADGEAAGQEVFHLHLHVYPRYTGDGFGFKYDKSKHFVKQARSVLDEVATEVKQYL
jgi:histidine triad (HIT) family protein